MMLRKRKSNSFTVPITQLLVLANLMHVCKIGAQDRLEGPRRSKSSARSSPVLFNNDHCENLLSDRIKCKKPEEESMLPTELLRKYILYARRYVAPVLSNDAKEILQDFYLHLRASASPLDGTPVTVRQLESMVRLAEARAKLELRETVTQKDAQVTIPFFGSHKVIPVINLNERDSTNNRITDA